MGIPGLLSVSLSSTNPIESALSTARKTTGRVKHWQSGTQVLRWLSCGFVGVGKKYRKINGYKLIPVFINALHGKDISTTSMVGYEVLVFYDAHVLFIDDNIVKYYNYICDTSVILFVLIAFFLIYVRSIFNGRALAKGIT